MQKTTDPVCDHGQALPSGTKLGEFIIGKVLGSGGFGITYLARDTSLSRQVVIKENLPTQFAWRETTTGTVRPRHTTGGDADDFEWSLNNFLKEAETLALLDHPGIVRVLRKFEANGTAYFVMPFVEGVAFDSLIEKRRAKGQAFSEEELKGLLDRMLEALGYLHARGIYHRDIKPGNILITNDGIPTLIDFGSARQRLSERSMTVVESAGYTPFEQLQSHGNVGPWSDLYALGATLVKVMTGEAPPKANDRIRKDPHVPLARREELAARFSAAFLGGIDKSLVVEETERWQNAGEWLVALRGNDTLATPPPKPERMARTSRPPAIASPAIASPAIASPAIASPAIASPAIASPVIASPPNKKVTRVQWAIATCVILSLSVVVLLVKISSSYAKPSARPVTVVDNAAVLRERDTADAATAQAKEAEQRTARAEQEMQALTAKARVQAEAIAKAAEAAKRKQDTAAWEALEARKAREQAEQAEEEEKAKRQALAMQAREEEAAALARDAQKNPPGVNHNSSTDIEIPNNEIVTRYKLDNPNNHKSALAKASELERSAADLGKQGRAQAQTRDLVSSLSGRYSSSESIRKKGEENIQKSAELTSEAVAIRSEVANVRDYLLSKATNPKRAKIYDIVSKDGRKIQAKILGTLENGIVVRKTDGEFLLLALDQLNIASANSVKLALSELSGSTDEEPNDSP
jgi:hypothetical protein